ncbi:ABC transporter ATP-binding protein [Paraburkholderia oxyphila]|uniref:ABC transporter ATP-binding protein n=1 Tax=Paraburkholderia oxyphila TaxID=614212 RepID=UPI000481E084|nr:ABC transporter ATP-binding protein [Paraburkholderia oxyphila]
MSLLELTGVTKRFGAFCALSDVNLAIARGEVHCLLGENGAGKSTLCNLIFGVHHADNGELFFDDRPWCPQAPSDALQHGIAMVHQHFSLVPDMSVLENLMLGRARPILKPAALRERALKLAAEYGLELDPDAIVERLSVGERQRVEIVKCLLANPRLLVLDEPTAVLPPAEVAALLAVCRQFAQSGRSVLLVTHKLAEIAEVAGRITVLRHGRVVESVPAANADMQALVRSMVGREVKSEDPVLAATLGIVEETPEAGANDAPTAPLTSSAMSMVHATHATPARRHAGAGAAALEVEGLSFRDATGVMRVDDVTLSVRCGEILGVAGVEGNGQVELEALLAGLATPDAGRIRIGGIDVTGRPPAEVTAAGAAIVPEDRHAVACINALSIAENLCLHTLATYSRFGWLDRTRMKRDAAALMQAFDVRAMGPDVPIGSLSGGNQQKAVLARELSLDPLVFLLASQPSRGLDVGAVEGVFRRIRTAKSQGLGVLLITSDLSELIAMSDRVVVLYRGRIVGEMDADPANREAIGAMMSGHEHA